MQGMREAGAAKRDGEERYLPIEDYALIGDCRSAALISRDGSLDWLCWPRFDSPAVFAAILDAQRGGRFSIRPVGSFSSGRSYGTNSNVLATQFATAGGAAQLTDLFYTSDRQLAEPLPRAMIIRELSGLDGEVRFDLKFEPRRDYGRTAWRLTERSARSVVFGAGEGLMHLAADFDFQSDGQALHAEVRVAKGERKTLILSLNESGPAVFPPLTKAAALIEATDCYWRRWSSGINYHGPHRAALVRSALALKLMEYAPSGAIIAAPTTSLPERVGADYNWDYRYCWLRDASFTVNALFGLGLQAEGEAFFQWLLHATHLTLPRLQVMYSVLGKPLLKEKVLDHLEGYQGSGPVRIGNAAHTQTQLDVYGEVVNAALICRRNGVRLSGDERAFLRHLVQYVLDNWRKPDAGIWETRLGDDHHVHSKAMCWLALARAAELAKDGDLDFDESELRRVAGDIRSVVIEEGFNARLGAYTATLGGEFLDAAVLRLPLIGFQDAAAPAMASTLEAVRARLGAGDLLFRHEGAETADEGAFLLCSFWLVECLALQGRIEEAEQLFDALCRQANDVGLYPEEVEPQSGRFLGNFPQAYTHVGLINAALRLEAARNAENGGMEWN